MRAPRPLHKKTPIEIAVHVIDVAIKDLLAQRKELAAQIPRPKRRRRTRMYAWDPSTLTRNYIEEKKETKP